MIKEFPSLASKQKKPQQVGNFKSEEIRGRALEALEGRRIDKFLEKPPKQPKKTIVEYMGGGENIFSNFNEAKKYLESNPNAEIIVRSEHPQEYDGASGLLKSYTFTKEDFNKISSQEDFE